MEDPQTIPSHGVSSVVDVLTDFVILWADIVVGRRAHSMSLKIIPESISVRSSSVVSNEYVIWMSDPEACGSLICVQKTPRSNGLDDQIFFNVVVSLNGIFNEDSVALDLVSNVVFESQVMGSVEGESSIISLMGS